MARPTRSTPKRLTSSPRSANSPAAPGSITGSRSSTKAATIRAAYDATRRGGTVTRVGAAAIDETVTFPALSLMADGKTTRGSVYGSSDPSRDIPVLADLALDGRLDLGALVTRRIGIDDVEAAFTDMAAGHGARSVVCFEPIA